MVILWLVIEHFAKEHCPFSSIPLRLKQMVTFPWWSQGPSALKSNADRMSTIYPLLFLFILTYVIFNRFGIQLRNHSSTLL